MSDSKILVATDFSEMSQFAIDYATTHASKTGATLLIMHAVAVPSPKKGGGMLHDGVDPEDLQMAERKLEAITAEVEGVRYEHRLVRGEPAQQILRLAEEENVDLIVMGTHGRTGLVRALMGSVAEQVVRNATCPVVTVKVPKSSA